MIELVLIADGCVVQCKHAGPVTVLGDPGLVYRSLLNHPAAFVQLIVFEVEAEAQTSDLFTVKALKQGKRRAQSVGVIGNEGLDDLALCLPFVRRRSSCLHQVGPTALQIPTGLARDKSAGCQAIDPAHQLGVDQISRFNSAFDFVRQCHDIRLDCGDIAGIKAGTQFLIAGLPPLLSFRL